MPTLHNRDGHSPTNLVDAEQVVEVLPHLLDQIEQGEVVGRPAEARADGRSQERKTEQSDYYEPHSPFSSLFHKLSPVRPYAVLRTAPRALRKSASSRIDFNRRRPFLSASFAFCKYNLSGNEKIDCLKTLPVNMISVKSHCAHRNPGRNAHYLNDIAFDSQLFASNKVAK